MTIDPLAAGKLIVDLASDHKISHDKEIPANHYNALLRYYNVARLSCHKQEVKTESTYTFTNTTGQRIMFDLYGSKEDYSRNANRMHQYIIEPGTAQQIEFEALKTYWIDWYSADYSMNNWRSTYTNEFDRPSPATEITIAAEDDHYSISSAIRDTSRSILMNGSGSSSTWQATITNSFGLNGIHRFVFKKDFSGEYTYTDTHGATSTKPIKYGISTATFSSVAQLSFTLSVMDEGLAEFCKVKANPGQFISPHTGRDTMLIIFPTISDIPVVRQ